MKQPCIYIMASSQNGTLYVGVTSDMPKRAFEHREGLVKGFTKKYGCKMLVWYELHDMMLEAIAREKQIKAGQQNKQVGTNRELESALERSLRNAGVETVIASAARQSRGHK